MIFRYQTESLYHNLTRHEAVLNVLRHLVPAANKRLNYRLNTNILYLSHFNNLNVSFLVNSKNVVTCPIDDGIFALSVSSTELDNAFSARTSSENWRRLSARSFPSSKHFLFRN